MAGQLFLMQRLSQVLLLVHKLPIPHWIKLFGKQGRHIGGQSSPLSR